MCVIEAIVVERSDEHVHQKVGIQSGRKRPVSDAIRDHDAWQRWAELCHPLECGEHILVALCQLDHSCERATASRLSARAKVVKVAVTRSTIPKSYDPQIGVIRNRCDVSTDAEQVDE
jgi:hypothetical protein